MHLLVTRPHPDANELIDQLQASGHQVSYFPLLEIKFHSNVKLPEKLPQAVLITSANGARGLGRHMQMSELTSVPAITVGPASAKAAQDAGFENIAQTGRGDVIGLIEHVRQHLRPENGPLLYASGTKTTGDLVGELQKNGFCVDRAVLYEAEPATQLPEDICQMVNSQGQDKLDGVLLFSPRTAKIWLSLTKGCISSDVLAKIKYYCLSENVAKIIDQGLGKFSDTIICDKPDTTSMQKAVYDVSCASSGS